MGSESSKNVIVISMLLKIAVAVFAIAGVIITCSGSRAFMGGHRAFMYFTIQSNIALATICIVDAFFVIKKRKDLKAWFVVRFMGVVSITLTGVVFSIFLAPTLGGYVWNMQNIITHIVVPLIAIADYLLTETYSNDYTCTSLWGTIPPLAYTIYAGIGYINKWEFATGMIFPYTFLNWGSPAGALGYSKAPPYLGCVWWILIILLFILLIGRVYIQALISLRQYKSGNGYRI